MRHQPADGESNDAQDREQRSIRRRPNDRKEAREPACEPNTVHCGHFRPAEIEPEQPTFPLNDTAEHSEGDEGYEAELPQLSRRRLQVQLCEHSN